MRRAIVLLGFILVLCTSGTVWALDFDFDDLFGEDLLVEFEEEESAIAPEEALLVQDGWDVGGKYNFSVNASRTLIEGVDPIDSWQTAMDSQIYLDARPDPNFRVFGKVGLNYVAAKTDGGEDRFRLTLQELFSDFNHDNKVFFRAGKQNLGWSVGYFFRPADIENIFNIGRVDPDEPEADREGLISLKAHYPKGSTNYYLYTLFDGVKDPSQVALAPKLEFVVGGTEIGLGGFYQKDKTPRAMLTLSSSIGNVAVFGEAVVGKETDRVFFQGTAGGRYSYSDPDNLFNLTGAAQYFYDGERSDKGEHNIGAVVRWSGILDTKFSASASWIANLTNKEGVVAATLSLPSISKISPSVGVRHMYKDLGPLGRHNATTVFAAITLGSGSF